MLVLTLNAKAADQRLLPPAQLKKITAQLSKHLGFDKKSFEAALAFVPAKTIQSLNHDFRGKKKPTNVLSFPQFTPAELKKLKPSAKQTIYLGDIILCKTVIVSEALKLKKPLNHHLIHLVVHGVLHLLGYDHMNNTESLRMETLEKVILAGLGIDDPYVIDEPKRERKKK
ncbi:MAG: rRNA maturation RNase YbeY [Alphaproteobacteria bacterium]|nr:rRNA maturation RNase YbeY [Alphaproteobacteria bacterium]